MDHELIQGNDGYARAFANMAKNPPNPVGLFYAWAVSSKATGWTPEQLTVFSDWITETHKRSAGNSFKGYLVAIRRQLMNALPEKLQSNLHASSANLGSDLLTNLPRAKGPGRAWTVDTALAEVEDLSHAKAQNGFNMYRATMCAACHTFNGYGGSAGPDLTHVGKRFDKKAILDAIFDPSASVSEQYHNMKITMRDNTVMIRTHRQRRQATHLSCHQSL